MPKNPLHLLLRLALAFIWIWTGVVVLFLAPIEDSLALMAPLGLPENVAIAVIWIVAILELGLGAALVANWRVREIALIQMALIAAFTLIITLFLPEQWLHPFGPVSKNIPLLAATYVLFSWAGKRSQQRQELYSFHDDFEG